MADILKKYFPMLKKRETLLAEIESEPKLNQSFHRWTILPTDSTRIADETSLLIMDIVVQLEDGPIVNLEVQKIGYKFPGERCACYSSDLLLRQYKRVQSKKKKKFSYKDIKGVYTIVLFEKSPQEYVFFALDIYKESHHNKVINKCEKQFDDRLEAWLGLLCMDEPEAVVQLIPSDKRKRPATGRKGQNVY